MQAVSTGTASPMSSSAPSPTDQLRLLVPSNSDDRRLLQPIGTERSSKKSSAGPSSLGGPLGFGPLRSDVGAGSTSLWSMSDMGGADWLANASPALVSSAAAIVSTATSMHSSVAPSREGLGTPPVSQMSRQSTPQQQPPAAHFPSSVMHLDPSALVDHSSSLDQVLPVSTYCHVHGINFPGSFTSSKCLPAQNPALLVSSAGPVFANGLPAGMALPPFLGGVPSSMAPPSSMGGMGADPASLASMWNSSQTLKQPPPPKGQDLGGVDPKMVSPLDFLSFGELCLKI